MNTFSPLSSPPFDNEHGDDGDDKQSYSNDERSQSKPIYRYSPKPAMVATTSQFIENRVLVTLLPSLFIVLMIGGRTTLYVSAIVSLLTYLFDLFSQTEFTLISIWVGMIAINLSIAVNSLSLVNHIIINALLLFNMAMILALCGLYATLQFRPKLGSTFPAIFETMERILISCTPYPTTVIFLWFIISTIESSINQSTPYYLLIILIVQYFLYQNNNNNNSNNILSTTIMKITFISFPATFYYSIYHRAVVTTDYNHLLHLVLLISIPIFICTTSSSSSSSSSSSPSSSLFFILKMINGMLLIGSIEYLVILKSPTFSKTINIAPPYNYIFVTIAVYTAAVILYIILFGANNQQQQQQIFSSKYLLIVVALIFSITTTYMLAAPFYIYIFSIVSALSLSIYLYKLLLNGTSEYITVEGGGGTQSWTMYPNYLVLFSSVVALYINNRGSTTLYLLRSNFATFLKTLSDSVLLSKVIAICIIIPLQQPNQQLETLLSNIIIPTTIFTFIIYSSFYFNKDSKFIKEKDIGSNNNSSNYNNNNNNLSQSMIYSLIFMAILGSLFYSLPSFDGNINFMKKTSIFLAKFLLLFSFSTFPISIKHVPQNKTFRNIIVFSILIALILIFFNTNQQQQQQQRSNNEKWSYWFLVFGILEIMLQNRDIGSSRVGVFRLIEINRLSIIGLSIALNLVIVILVYYKSIQLKKSQHLKQQQQHSSTPSSTLQPQLPSPSLLTTFSKMMVVSNIACIYSFIACIMVNLFWLDGNESSVIVLAPLLLFVQSPIGEQKENTTAAATTTTTKDLEKKGFLSFCYLLHQLSILHLHLHLIDKVEVAKEIQDWDDPLKIQRNHLSLFLSITMGIYSNFKTSSPPRFRLLVVVLFLVTIVLFSFAYFNGHLALYDQTSAFDRHSKLDIANQRDWEDIANQRDVTIFLWDITTKEIDWSGLLASDANLDNQKQHLYKQQLKQQQQQQQTSRSLKSIAIKNNRDEDQDDQPDDDEFEDENEKVCDVSCSFTNNHIDLPLSDYIVFDPSFIHRDDWRRSPLNLPEKLPFQKFVLLDYFSKSQFPILADPRYTSLMDLHFNYSADSTQQLSLACPPDPSFTTKNTTSLLLNNHDSKPWQSRKGLVFISSNCKVGFAKSRINYIKSMKTIVDIDTFGKCFEGKSTTIQNMSTKPTNINEIIKSNMKEFENYKFALTFENENTTDYVSEKVYSALYSGAIPVYMGSKNIGNWVPTGSIIKVSDYSSPTDLANYLKKVIDDPNEYKKYFEWKKSDLEQKVIDKLRMCVNGFHSKCKMCKMANDVLSIKQLELKKGLMTTHSSYQPFHLQMQGKGDHIKVDSSNCPTCLDLSEKYTLMAWVKPTSFGDQRVIDKNTGGTVDGYNFDIQKATDSSRGIARLCAGGTCFSSHMSFSPDVWTHIAVTYSVNNEHVHDNKVNFFINGKKDIPQDFFNPTAKNKHPVLIGASNGIAIGDSGTYNGNIDNIAIYNRSLNNQEIINAMWNKPFGDEKDILLYFDFDVNPLHHETKGTVKDRSIYGNNGILVAVVIWLFGFRLSNFYSLAQLTYNFDIHH
ncbi:hypothetical protein DFA_04816 [Cavenderia fasciculata]|uniref:Fucosyltransferase n=1 Tax=Cavenderia fasciculata TaxID=261658 RepID=F4PLT0_CACFS|nr:uncharacterized protein DFA_04816 [Cavenderia fasciculata]EGG22686.1 hypothetical protein DFA_04816 [Cavenderia fasciculata]|eukprot:XP_004360537.1 hypothetical protein DFA_04816 [Cavenderia fasciculata]